LDRRALAHGVYPTMITPFTAAGGIDWAGLDRLVDWYLERGAKGLFAVCGSSELDALTLDERFALCERVAARAAPHPVVASGTFGGPLPLQAGDCRRMVEAGARAAVILTGNLAVGEESDDTWRARLGELMDLTAPIPLGFYERPGPNNRAIPPGTLGELARTGRFLFHKDTTCDLELIGAKAAAVAGTPLGFYNANASSLLHSLRAGGAGFSGIAASFYPDLIGWLCTFWDEEPDLAKSVQDIITALEPAIGHHYPLSAKIHLRGLGLEPICRVEREVPSASDLRTLEAALAVADRVRKDLGLAS
jgi:4-hydroxy-tetrahydrodipicolinate synthase